WPVRLGWQRSVGWTPVLCGAPASSSREPHLIVVEELLRGLRGKAVSPDAEKKRIDTLREVTALKKQIAEKREEINLRGLRGAERKHALQAELGPLEVERDRRRLAWLESLADAVPSPELAIGKHLDCTNEEYRVQSLRALSGGGYNNR